MTEIGKKIFDIVKAHPEFNEAVVLEELRMMSQYDVAEQVYFLHQQLDKKPPGNDNVLNSLVLYLLGTTTKRPEGKFVLNKRRTYGRKGFPDIDMDFDYLRRHEIVEYFTEKYGQDRVGNIGTVQRLQTKAALRRVIKVLDPANSRHFDQDGKEDKAVKNENFALENAILDELDSATMIAGGKLRTKNGNVLIDSVRSAYENISGFRRYMDAYPDIAKYASRVEGSISAYGCLAKDTTVETDSGRVRIDQISPKFCAVAYLDKRGDKRYTTNYIAHKTGFKKVYKLRLVNGDWIKVTDEHLVFTDKGCVLFEEIRKNPKNYKVMSVKNSNTIPAACKVTQEVSSYVQMPDLRKDV